ncbi:MAG: efflux RND transporter permease subunit [Pseudomonadota bacterium]
MIDFSIKNPLVVNLLLLLVVIMGVVSWQSMPEEMFPVVDKDAVRILTKFEGASPEEIEEQVTSPIEESLDNLQDIDFFTSDSAENFSRVFIKLKPGTNVDEFMRRVRDTADAITDFPEEVEIPEITRVKTRFPVISVSLFGEAAPGFLFDLSDRLKQQLLQLRGVAGVGVAGNRDWELWVTVNPAALSAKQVSINSLIRVLQANVRDLPGGSVKSQEGDILLRGVGATDIVSIGNIVLRSNPQGGQLLLREVAVIEKRLEEVKTLGRFNGKRAINMTITKTAEASVFNVSENVRYLVANFETPHGVEVGVYSDFSKNVKKRLDTVRSSGVIGLLLLLLSLYIFLNLRVAVITALGIPVSFLIAAVVMNGMGYTINMVSLFAFLVVLGMIVDDAIIVTENTYRHIESGLTPQLAAIKGAREVFWPIVASTLTTIAAFLPMFGITGTLGVFIQVIPVVVTAALIGSLFEAFLILPSHSAFLLKLERNRKKYAVDWNSLLDRYTKLLKNAIVNRYLVSSLTIGMLAIVVAFAATRIPYHLLGKIETGQFFINIEAPITYGVKDTEDLAKKIEGIIFEELDNTEVESVLTNVGISLIDFNRFKSGSHYIQMVISLHKSKPEGFIDAAVTPVVNLTFDNFGERERTTASIIDALRSRLASVPGIQRFSILRPHAGPAGPDIEIGVTGPETADLLNYAEKIKSYLQRLPGVQDSRHDQEPGKIEYRYSVNERGKELGLSQADISKSVRSGFLGLEVTQVNIGEKRIPVRLIYPESSRTDSSSVFELPIVLDDGATVYLSEVANIEIDRGINTVRRRDGQRLATITAEVNDSIITPGEAIKLVEKNFRKEFSNNRYDLIYLGSKKRTQESFSDMKRVLLVALALIFFILAVLFKSITDPLVVMFSIPFGVVGVILGHILFSYNLQFLSIIGLLALTGIVVNDSLILIDFLKKERKRGIDRYEATLNACRVRARPILLTSVTTILAISPLIFFATGQTRFLSPMAVSLGFGLLFSTILILFVLPCFYLITDDCKNGLKRFLSSRRYFL